jgi:hypothetical protein
MFLKKILPCLCMLLAVSGVCSLAQAQQFYSDMPSPSMQQVRYTPQPIPVDGLAYSKWQANQGNQGWPGTRGWPGSPMPLGNGGFLGGGTLSGTWNGPFNPNNQYHGSINSQGIHMGYTNPLTGRSGSISFNK